VKAKCGLGCHFLLLKTDDSHSMSRIVLLLLDTAMPTISMFYGIIIYLYFFDDERHKLPYIHARYQGNEASFSIADGELL
jgi:hypothetical protein